MTTARHLVVVAGAESAATDGLVSDLRAEFAVRTAYDRESLTASLDDEVDVVVVDDDLPDCSPEAVRTHVRERDLDCQVGVLIDRSAAEPPGERPAVDGYVRRGDDDPTDPVERLALRAHYRKRLSEFYELAEEYADLSIDAERREAGERGDGAVESDGDEADAATGEGTDAATGGETDVAAELDRMERYLDRLRSDLEATFERLDDESVFDVALDRPDDGE